MNEKNKTVGVHKSDEDIAKQKVQSMMIKKWKISKPKQNNTKWVKLIKIICSKSKFFAQSNPQCMVL